MDNYYDEIELEYNNFLAEQELFDNLISLGSSTYHESVGLVLIQEDYKDSVNKYVEKIVSGLQKAWENFKNKVIETPLKKVLDQVKDRIDSYDGTAEVQYWHKYDLPKFDNLKMVDFNLELLKSCKDKTDYYEKAYPGYMVDKEKSLKENIINQVINTEDTHIITKEEMVQMYDFCTRQFTNMTDKLKDDLKRLNTNINTLKTIINVSTSGSETTTTVNQQTTVTNNESYNSAEVLNAIYESVLYEAGPEDNDTKSTKIVKDTDAGVDKEKANTQKNNIKYMNWYLAGNADVFSVKMKILRQRFLDAIRIIKALFPKEKKETENKNEVEVKATTTTKDQVKI